MAIHFNEPRATSEGPLDVAHNGGASDNAPFTLSGDNPSDANEPLVPLATPLADDEELLRQKNPLGYTVTEPTEEEINQASDKAAANGTSAAAV